MRNVNSIGKYAKIMLAGLTLLSGSVSLNAREKSNTNINRESVEFKTETRKMYDLVEKSFSEGKSEPIVFNFYSEDNISLGPDGKPEFGRNPLLKSYGELVSAFNIKLESRHAFVNKEAGWDWVNLTLTPKDTKSQKNAMSFVILYLWVKKDEKWSVVGDAYVPGVFAK